MTRARGRAEPTSHGDIIVRPVRSAVERVDLGELFRRNIPATGVGVVGTIANDVMGAQFLKRAFPAMPEEQCAVWAAPRQQVAITRSGEVLGGIQAFPMPTYLHLAAREGLTWRRAFSWTTLTHLAVDKRYRGGGLGGELVAQLESSLSADPGIKYLAGFAEGSSSATELRDFYRSMGHTCQSGGTELPDAITGVPGIKTDQRRRGFYFYKRLPDAPGAAFGVRAE